MKHQNFTLKTGDVFHAKNKLGNSYFYEFVGVNLNDLTGCNYIALHDLTNDTITEVEIEWFKQRIITPVAPGMKFFYPDGKGIISGITCGTYAVIDKEGKPTIHIPVNWADLELVLC